VSRHVSGQFALESTRRRLTPKQADTIARLSTAALVVLRRVGFCRMTVRTVAAEAGVGAATAYTYFSSKEHLVAEVFWRRLASQPFSAFLSLSLPFAASAGADSPDAIGRVVAVLRHLALLVPTNPSSGAR
jgi:TetR/AcrR family transcriptional regulator, cholesterol catabolism regulator